MDSRGRRSCSRPGFLLATTCRCPTCVRTCFGPARRIHTARTRERLSYWSLTIDGSTRPEFVWTYRWPHAESQKVAGLACFYNERVDIYVDGELGTPQDEVQLSRSTSYQLTVTTSSR